MLNPKTPYTWASGWKSPIYCDNRIILSYPQVRKYIEDALVELIQVNFPQADAISGVATAGIAHAAIIADRLNLPMSYIRSKPKDHGTGKMVEGSIAKGAKVVVIEDLISTGKSSMAAIEAAKTEAGAEVIGVAAIFSYGFDTAHQLFESSKIPLYTLSDYENLMVTALSRSYISFPDTMHLASWRQSPSTWGV